MKKPRIRQQRQTTRVTAKPVHYDSDFKNTSPRFYKFLPWLTVILLAVAILVAGGALIMGIQALRHKRVESHAVPGADFPVCYVKNT